MAFWDGLLNWLGYGHDEDTPAGNQLKELEWSSPPPHTGKAKLVSLPTARQAMRLVIARPQSFDQAAALAENLKNYRPLIVNVEALPFDEARRIIDFLSGATYALGGRVRRVTSGIFLFTSSNVDLSGDLEEQVTGGINWLEAAGRK
ncbi:cell division protein SepF [Moorella sulfitireducens]|uniref:cell division protein SepF n=1 Tax=Neomoorella sulfitireducens TaxID=2972948 RepID=UPI0021AC2077|nr:cell division protein SepF [Moorella sulfitireducens]